MSDALTEWLPTIIEIAIISMMIGMLARFSGRGRR